MIRPDPFVIGLTGSIGMGKSTTAALFAEAGVPVWDADAAVARLYGVGGAAVPALADLRADLIEDGAVSRDRLRAWIAEDPQALSRVEAVVHPLVAADREAFLAATEAPLVVLDVPLLFEGAHAPAVDHVVVVTVPEAEQRRRVLDRLGMTEARLAALLARQMPDIEKQARADTVIQTTTLDAARAQVQTLLHRLKAEHARDRS